MKDTVKRSEITSVTITPSQWVNIGWFLLAFAGGCAIDLTGSWLFAAPIVWWLWKFAVIECWQFSFDEETNTIVERKGVFSVNIIEINYFRIKSVRVRKPFLMRLVGISIVEVITTEPFKPYLVLYAVRRGNAWANFLREMAASHRNRKGVRENDFHII